MDQGCHNKGIAPSSVIIGSYVYELFGKCRSLNTKRGFIELVIHQFDFQTADAEELEPRIGDNWCSSKDRARLREVSFSKFFIAIASHSGLQRACVG